MIISFYLILIKSLCFGLFSFKEKSLDLSSGFTLIGSFTKFCPLFNGFLFFIKFSNY
jgi:hypothetical protein